VHVIYPTAENGVFLPSYSVAGSTPEVKQKLCKQKTVLQNTSSIFQLVMRLVLLLSCDDVLKFDWSCQLSGLEVEVTVQSCQAISPTAWEQGTSQKLGGT